MAKLEDLGPKSVVSGLTSSGEVTVVACEWHGTSAATLTYRDAQGIIGERLLLRDDEAGLTVRAPGLAFSFDGDGALFRLVAEARRIQLAHLFDPMLAVSLSAVEPLPHQIQAVYGEMLPRQPLRFLLADDPGAGKTIMAGLYIKELALRGDLQRCLIVAPFSLVVQWQDELRDKFDLRFELLTKDMIEASADPFEHHPLLIARLDQLSRNEELQTKLARTDWDLVVVDEAHRMSAHFYGSKVKTTKRYELGMQLGRVARHLLLMTTTPHAGKEEDFQLFLALLDGDRFEGRFRDGVHTIDPSDLMRRMVKEKLLRFDGKPLFPERRAYTVNYPLSPLEQQLYDEVTAYVSEEMNRADRLAAAGQGRRGNTVGFALTVLQRRLASSPEAIYQSLARRKKRLEQRISDERQQRRLTTLGLSALETPAQANSVIGDDGWDPDAFVDLDEAERERLEDDVVDQASAAQTIEELEREVRTLGFLVEVATRVRQSGSDRKWMELASLLSDQPEMFEGIGAQRLRRKLIVFTEHRDTLNYLVDRLRQLTGRPESVVSIHGGIGRDERRAIQERFTQEPTCLLLVATDAAGEGVNLQRSHLLVNYDLPWNPNRLEQRFGRIHRIGQAEVCHCWNLLAADTREGAVYERLLAKLELQRKALGGQVFDVLGAALSGRELRDLLVQAIRYGNEPAVRAKLDKVIDARVGDGLRELIAAEALAADVLGAADVELIRVRLEEAQARRLQPHYVREFFLRAFELLGGKAHEREPSRFELRHVPQPVRDRDRLLGSGAPVAERYERVAFDKSLTGRVGDEAPPAQLLAPGHPLLDATIDLVLERHRSVLRQGTVLVDDVATGERPHLLVFLVCRRFEFVQLDELGESSSAGHAPYLDYRPVTDDERRALQGVLDGGWLRSDVEHVALGVAYRALDDAEQLLTSISAATEATAVAKHKAELLRLRLPTSTGRGRCRSRSTDRSSISAATRPRAASPEPRSWRPRRNTAPTDGASRCLGCGSAASCPTSRSPASPTRSPGCRTVRAISTSTASGTGSPWIATSCVLPATRPTTIWLTAVPICTPKWCGGCVRSVSAAICAASTSRP